MTIVTFINFDYNNGRYDSTVYLHLKHETGRAIGINGYTIDYDCCCDL